MPTANKDQADPFNELQRLSASGAKKLEGVDTRAFFNRIDPIHIALLRVSAPSKKEKRGPSRELDAAGRGDEARAMDRA